MKSVIVIHDTEARTFIVDRYNTQVVRDFVKSALETEFAFDSGSKDKCGSPRVWRRSRKVGENFGQGFSS